MVEGVTERELSIASVSIAATPPVDSLDSDSIGEWTSNEIHLTRGSDVALFETLQLKTDARSFRVIMNRCVAVTISDDDEEEEADVTSCSSCFIMLCFGVLISTGVDADDSDSMASVPLNHVRWGVGLPPDVSHSKSTIDPSKNGPTLVISPLDGTNVCELKSAGESCDWCWWSRWLLWWWLFWLLDDDTFIRRGTWRVTISSPLTRMTGSPGVTISFKSE